MNILIVYGSTEGQTRKIAGYLKTEAEKSGHQVTLVDSTNHPPGPEGFDVVLIGASLHMHKYQTAVLHYIKENAEALNKITSGFFSVSLAAASSEDESLKELDKITNDFLKETGWKPIDTEQVKGALLFTKYDFFKKLVMRMIAKRSGETDTTDDHEYTDWAKVKAFLDRMLKT